MQCAIDFPAYRAGWCTKVNISFEVEMGYLWKFGNDI